MFSFQYKILKMYNIKILGFCNSKKKLAITFILELQDKHIKEEEEDGYKRKKENVPF